MIIVDAHAHLVPGAFPPPLAGVTSHGWPQMIPREDGRARMVIDGKDFRVIERAYFDIEERLRLMDEEGVALQVVSPLPELLGHWLAPDTAAALAIVVNEAVAGAVQAAPARLAGLGMLPWQDAERAAGMAADLAAMGLRGVHVGSNIDGRSAADPMFDPVFAELARLGLAVFVHGTRPAAPERQLGPRLMANVVGVPQDCATAIASFIVSDVLGRHPGLRLGFAHGGGTFGAVLDRMDFVWREFPALRETCPVPPRDYVRRFFFDTVTYSVPYLQHLIAAFGGETLFCGSDGPAIGAQSGLGRMVEEACGGDRLLAEQIAWRNAARFLGLTKLAEGV